MLSKVKHYVSSTYINCNLKSERIIEMSFSLSRFLNKINPQIMDGLMLPIIKNYYKFLIIYKHTKYDLQLEKN